MDTRNQDISVISPSKQPKRRRTVRWLTIVVLVVGAGSLFFVLRGDSGVSAAPGATVKIGGTTFTPQTIKVQKGQSVTWVNEDSTPHHIMANPYPTGGSLPSLNSTEPLAQGESYTATFDKSGTYAYLDLLNPATLHGVVIVE